MRTALVLFGAVWCSVGLSITARADGVSYESDIKPLLKARCYGCHGVSKQEAGLRLDTGELVRRGGDSGAAVVAAKPDASLLIDRVSADDPSERMPPEGPALTDKEILLLRRWIESGADSPADEQPQTLPPQYEHGEISIPMASADEATRDSVSVELAHQYLEDGATAWNAQRKCITCHTNGTYMVVRPALSTTLGRPDESTRALFLSELQTFRNAEPEFMQQGVRPAQAIYLAAGLAEWDAHVTGELATETSDALALMLQLQTEDSSWGSQDCWPPYESDSYHLATVAAMAVGTAPGWLDQVADRDDQNLLTRIEKLKTLLRSPPPHDYGRVLLLWASTRLPDLLNDEEQQDLIELLSRHQRDDGGWSLRTMAAPEAWGSGNRAKKLRSEEDFETPASDGHMTGLAIVVLREAGIRAEDSRVARGLTWLKQNQRESGRWWTRSLNTDNSHFITYSGTAFPLLALQLCRAE